MPIVDPAAVRHVKLAGVFLALVSLSACATTSGSDRLDEAGEQMAEANAESDTPENSAYYIQALKGGLIARIADVKLSNADKARALEAEYKVLETTPSGQTVDWIGASAMKGQVVAAVPYQVGSQNCRQYTHSLWLKAGAEPKVARGAACRNKNGTWTLL